MKSERFLYCLRKAVFFHISIQEPHQKLPRGFDAAFFKTVFRVFKKLCRVQVYLRKETLQPAQVALAKTPRN